MPLPTVTVGKSGFLGFGKEAELGTAVAPTKYLAFDAETFGLAIDRDESGGIVGSRGRSKLRSVQTLKRPGGGFSYSGVKCEDLALILEAVAGAPLTDGSITLAETLPSFTFLVYKGVNKFTYAGSKVGRIRLSSSRAAQLLKLDVEEVLAITEVEEANDLTAAYTSTQRPLVHRDSHLTVDGSAIEVEEISTDIQNVFDGDVFYNSQTRLAVPELDRAVSGRLVLPWNTTTDTAAYAKFLSGAEAALETWWTDGTNTLKVVCPHVYFTGETPKIAGRSVVNLPLPFEAKDSADGANDSIEILILTA